MINQHKWTTPAPHGKRLIAFLIDSTISQVACQGIIYVLGTGAESSQLVAALLTVLYFVVFHSQFGWTPGKKILGLEIVSKDSEKIPSFLAILGRETVGRAISVAFLGIGYLVILFHTDREGFHDQIFKTQVVTQEVQEEGSSVWSWILGAAGSVAAIALVFFYVVFFTSVPLKEMAKSFEKQGVKIDGIEGNIMNGFSIAHVSHSSPQGEFTAEHMVLSYKNLLEIYTTGILHIREVSVAKMTMKILPRQNEPAAPEASQPKPEAVAEGAPPKAKTKTKIQIVVDRIDVNDFEISYADQNRFRIDRFLVTDLDLNAKEEIPRLHVSRIWFNSTQFLVDISLFNASGGNIDIHQGQVILKKELKPELLASDVDLQFQLKLNLAEKRYEGSIEALRRSLRASYVDNQLDLKTVNLHPHWYLKNFPPVHSMNLQVKAGLLELMMAPPVNGHYSIRNRQFVLANPPRPGQILAADSDFNGKRISSRLLFRGVKEWAKPFDLALESQHFEDLQGALSHLYFSKPAQVLNPTETLLLQSDSKQFSYQKSPSPLQASPNLGKPKSPSQRLPAYSDGFKPIPR